MKLVPVIGLEIHTQLNTKSKLFCDCSAASFGEEPNTQVCPVCLGLPGIIPSPPNIEAIKKAVLVAKALNCRLASGCYFERKNYFYPDLPKGYQISQYQTAIGEKGRFSTWDGQGEAGIRRVHLEEDAAKLIHEPGQTLIDFNRAGVPLLEIVTEPGFETPAQAETILKELRFLFRELEVSDADMEKGSLRLEANVSLRKEGTRSLPDYRVELKNINSFNFLVRALEKEIERQRVLIQMGKKIVQETRGYSEERDETFSQRRKEEAFDYRYFPEPDLPPLTTTIEKAATAKETKTITFTVDGILVTLKQRYRSLGLSPQYAEVLLKDRDLAALFEEVRKEIPASDAANAIVNKRFGDPKKLGAKRLIEAIKKSKKKVQISEAKITRYIDKVILDNPKAVRDYKAGKETALHFLLGALMKETKGRIDPSEVKGLLKKRLQQ